MLADLLLLLTFSTLHGALLVTLITDPNHVMSFTFYHIRPLLLLPAPRLPATYISYTAWSPVCNPQHIDRQTHVYHTLSQLMYNHVYLNINKNEV